MPFLAISCAAPPDPGSSPSSSVSSGEPSPTRAGPSRAFPDGERRDALPRRDRPPAGGGPGQDPGRDRGARTGLTLARVAQARGDRDAGASSLAEACRVIAASDAPVEVALAQSTARDL